ncbi:MAG: alditol oxidase [Nocardioidaceae bacterium]|nr:alditol oxidase [Nocardioidaceae bacterium]
MTPAAQRQNWAGNVTFAAQRLHRPESIEQLQAVVAASRRVRALGSGHSFSRIADTTGDQVSLDGLPETVVLDTESSTVTISAGVRYGDLAAQLQAAGRALPNLASLPHISVAGACATATHGSGDANRCLATAVSGMELVKATGDVVTLSRDDDPDELDASVVGLGSLGIVTRLTLDTVPAFDVAQSVYEDMPWEELIDGFAEVFASAYSVSVFTDWHSPRVYQVWLKRRSDHDEAHAPQRHWRGATLADGPRNPVPGMSPVHATEQLGVPGPWHERLPHFRLAFTPSNGEELQSEYFLSRGSGVDAVESLWRIRERIAPVLQIAEIRTIAADGLWMSPCYRRDSVAFHFTWVKDIDRVTPVVAAVERALAPYDPRPHWGKLFTMSPELVRAQYERESQFRHLLQHFDPGRKFRNDLVNTYLPAHP